MTKSQRLWLRAASERLRRAFGLEISTGTVSCRLGFLTGHIEVPDDFDSMGGPEIEQMFGGVA